MRGPGGSTIWLSWGIGELEELTHRDCEVPAQLFNGFELDPNGGFLVEQGEHVSVQAGGQRHVSDPHFPLAHQPGEVALNHSSSEMSPRMLKRLDGRHCAA